MKGQGQGIPIIKLVHEVGHHQRLGIGKALKDLSPGPGPSMAGNQKGSHHGDDAQDHYEFNQRESLGVPEASRFFIQVGFVSVRIHSSDAKSVRTCW
jgi:hypothetical protein